MLSKLFHFFWVFWFLLSSLNLLSQPYKVRTFSNDHGLSQSYIYSLTQDESGKLWIGTSNGLFQYNGFDFLSFPSDSLKNVFISALFHTGQNAWIGQMNGAISVYNSNLNTINSNSGENNPVVKFLKSPKGEIWATTLSNSFLQLKNNKIIYHRITKDVTISSVCFLDNKSLLIGTLTGLYLGVLKKTGEIEITKTLNDIPQTKISVVKKLVRNKGHLIATENDGLFYLNEEYKVSSLNLELKGIQDFLEHTNGEIWISTFGKGVVKIILTEGGNFSGSTYLNSDNGYPLTNVKTLFEDREGVIWCGTYGEGLMQIIPNPFNFSFLDAPFGNNIGSICLSSKYQWLTTEKGIIKKDQVSGSIVKLYEKGKQGLPDDIINSIYAVNDNELWIGTEANGLYHLNDNSFKKLFLSDGDLENSVNIIIGKSDFVWVGTKKGLCRVNIRTLNKQWYTNKDGLPHNFVNSIFIDHSEQVWVSTRSNMLSVIHNGKINKFYISQDESNYTLGPVTEDQHKRIWVGSFGKGVFMIENDSITNFNTKSGLLSNFCYSFICDNQNRIWIVHKSGLSNINTEDFRIQTIKSFETNENFQFNQHSSDIDKYGKLWFGTDKGLMVYDPEFEIKPTVSPALSISAIWINDEQVKHKRRIELNPGNYKLRISFLGINLKEPSAVSYQYKLDGYDQWSELTKQTSVLYPHLTEGDYKFMLRAISSDGIMTETPLSVTIIINKPFWKKWWFYPGLIILIFSISFFLIKRRELRFLTEKRILEEKVLERTYEINTQKKEIEIQKDAIQTINAQLTSSITYARFIQNAILPPLELIDRYIPHNFILYKPKDIVSGDFFWITEKDKKIVVAVADCTGHGVPGAFMSLLGITLLNEIVNIDGILKADEIVSTLRMRLIQSLHQNRKESTPTDGMDICLCVLDFEKRKLQYTGGLNDLVYIRNGQLEILKADRFSVGANIYLSKEFTSKEMEIKTGDIFYLFTDGYKDQFGGEFDKKFLIRRLYNTLLNIHNHPMPTQKAILEETLVNWMGKTEQTDDILALGIRMP